LIPLAAIGAYTWLTRKLYGHALLLDAWNYTSLPGELSRS